MASLLHSSMGEVRQATCVVIVVAFITKGCSAKGSYSHSKLIINIVVIHFTTELTVHKQLRVRTVNYHVRTSETLRSNKGVYLYTCTRQNVL